MRLGRIGGRGCAVIPFTLIETAKLDGLEPGTYCRDVLARYQQATRFLELDQP